MTTPTAASASRSLPTRIGALLLTTTVVTLVWATLRVVTLERKELDYSSRATALSSVPESAKTARLGLVTLERGDNVSFDVCSESGFDRALFLNAIDVAVWQPDTRELLVRTPFDDARLAHARRTVNGTCVEVAQGTVAVSGPYAIEVVWEGRTLSPTLAAMPMVTRVRALRMLATSDKAPVWLGFAFALFAVMIVATYRNDARDTFRTSGPALTFGGGVLLFVLAFVASEFLPWGGASGAMLRGVFLASVQVAIAYFLIARGEFETRAHALGWHGAKRNRWLMGPACVLLGSTLAILNGVVTARLIPSTSEAPIEALISFPSARLAVGAIALVAPMCEELFFRGFIFGSIDRRWGRTAAWTASVLVFAVAHLPQTWGAWGSTVSVLITGIVLTGVRARTGSTAASMLTHLSHNAMITLLSL